MAKMRIYELAKSLNVKSTDLVKKLSANGFTAKSPQSNIEDDAIAYVLKNFTPKKKDESIISKEADKTKKTADDTNKKEIKVDIKGDNNNTFSVQKASEKKKKEVQEDAVKNETVQKPQSTVRKEKTEKVVNVIENNTNIKKGNQDKPVENKANGSIQKEKTVDVQKEEKRIEVKVENREENKQVERRDNGDNKGQNRNQGGNRQGGQNNSRRHDNRNGQRRDGDRPYNRDNNGQRKDGDRPYNRDNNGQRRDGNRPYNRDNNGQRRDGDRPYNRDNNGQRRDGKRPYNRDNNGPRRDGDRPYNNGPRRDGDRPYNNGPRRDGNRPYNRDNGGNGRRPGSKPGESLDKMIAKAEEIQKPNRAQNKGKRQTDSRYNKQDREFDGGMNKGKNGKRNNKKGMLEQPKKDPNRKGAFQKPKVEPVVEEKITQITIPETLTLKELGDKMKIPAAQIVKKLFLQGKMVSINSEITFEEAEEIALEYDIIAEQEVKVDVIAELLKEEEEDESLMVKRPPVVCVMGHVDHGKTSLLDAIRHSNVTDREAGGITQHIGASVVSINDQKITFLDTPGHEAFTSMRMRGAQSTDIAVLVVAADDGVMPQTIEAISHAKAAGVEIIVAVNKIDKPSANIERVKQELVEYELVAEDWGGDTIFVPVSAHTKEGIPQLLEMIALTAEILELKANPNRKARGIVIEAQLDKGRGPVATVLVQKGTLHVGDTLAIGSAYGRVRAMMDDRGRRVKEAGPSMPVEILGLNEVPDAGEIFMATDNEKEARNISETYIKESREKLLDDTKAKLSLDGLFSQIQAGNIKELNIIVKADVQGSVEAVKQSLLKLSNEEVAVRIIHGGVGAINESDVTLASASNAIIIGFNVRPDNLAKEMVEREKVDMRLYRVIYQAIEDIQAAMKGLLDPIFEEKVIGHLEVRQVFKASGVGIIAGSYVLDGKVVRGCSARITRDGEQIFEGQLASLKRFKDDVKEVNAGYECGLVFEKYNDLKEEDKIEVYVMEEVPR